MNIYTHLDKKETVTERERENDIQKETNEMTIDTDAIPAQMK